jgi:AbrB family looped-hinge helix DNA binding protein
MRVGFCAEILLFHVDGARLYYQLGGMMSGSDTVRFTTKGQVVIPLRLRKEFNIEEGTRAVVTATPDGILIQPVTRHAINKLRGILKRKAGGKPFAQEWADHKRDELELEERKYGRGTGSR